MRLGLHCTAGLDVTNRLTALPCYRQMLQVENEDLVFTLEVMVEKFGDEIAPYAVSASCGCACLCGAQRFWLHLLGMCLEVCSPRLL
jgi:hypothetical protein